MQVGSATSKSNSQDIPRNEIPPIIEKIAKYGFWIGAGLCFGFWIHSAFVYAGAAFFLASFVCSQIVTAERSPKNSPAKAVETATRAAAASASGIGREPGPRPTFDAKIFEDGAGLAGAQHQGQMVDELFSDEEGAVPGGLTQEEMDELDEQEALAGTHGDAVEA
jgi:hypothetical protein